MRVILPSHVSTKEKGAKSPLWAASVEDITLSFYIYTGNVKYAYKHF